MTYGEYGSMNKKEGKAQCHICGQWFLNVGLHINRGHQMDCADYRAQFGLSRNYPLAGDAFINRQRNNHSERLKTYKTTGMAMIMALTVEERRRLRQIPRRESTRLKNIEARKRENSVERLHQSPKRLPALLEALKRPEYKEKLSNNWFRRPIKERESHMKKMRDARWAKKGGITNEK